MTRLVNTCAIVLLVGGLLLDLLIGNGLFDYMVLSFTLCFIMGYIYLAFRLVEHSNDIDIVQLTKPKVKLTLIGLGLFAAVLVFVAYTFYLQQPMAIIDAGKYRYHGWTFGLFILSHALFISYLLSLIIYRVASRQIR